VVFYTKQPAGLPEETQGTFELSICFHYQNVPITEQIIMFDSSKLLWSIMFDSSKLSLSIMFDSSKLSLSIMFDSSKLSLTNYTIVGALVEKNRVYMLLSLEG